MAVGMFVSKPTCPKRLESYCTSQSALAFQPPAGLQTLFGVGGLSGYGGQWPALIWHDFFNARFNSLPLSAFPPVNGDGQKWNLMGPNAGPKPKKKPQQQQQQGGGPPGCHGHHHFGPGQCGHNPPPTPTPTATATATPTPTPTPTGHGHGGPATTAASGAAGAGALALAAVVVVGPALSVTGRLRHRRRRKAAWPPAD
jgi:hypothetical protein